MSEIEWRRRWKPGFHAQTWTSLRVGADTYLAKSHFSDVLSSYQVLISDCKSVWYETLDEDQIKKRSKKLNPSVEAPTSKLLQHIREQLEEQPKGTDFTVSIREQTEDQDGRLLLTVTSKLAGLPFVWKFNATLATKEMVAEHLTLPLLTMVSEYQRREQELFKMLAAKDKEIEDLRVQGVKSSRRHLETAPFDETVFNNNMDTSKGFESRVLQMGGEAFEAGGQTLYKGIMAKYAWLHRPPPEDSEGESLVDEASAPTSGATVGESWANRIPPSVGVSATVTASPKKSPAKSPAKSPGKAGTTLDPSPTKDTELLRRQALERRLAEEEAKQEQKVKKKKKMKF